MGTYGCLINDEIYSETFMKLPVEPELKSNVGHVVELGSNVTLTCTARSQAISTIMWMLDEFPVCDQSEDECIIGMHKIPLIKIPRYSTLQYLLL